jgi:ribose transport system permease protein
MTGAETSGSSSAQRLRHRSVGRHQALPISVATVVLFIISALAVSQSLSNASLLAMMLPATILALAATGQTLVVQQRGIDLSTAGAISLAGNLLGVLAVRHGFALGPAIIVVLVVAGLGGLLNGLVIITLGITPIIATLASNSLLYGVLWLVSSGSSVSTPSSLATFASGRLVWWIPNIAVVAAAIILITAIVMAKSAMGRRFVGVGANRSAARATGVGVNRYIVASYVASGVFSGLAGIFLVGYLGSSTLNLGDTFQLPIIAAVVVGGASLTGGRGSVIASAIAAVFIEQAVQAVLSDGAATSTQLLVQGLVLVAAALLRLVPYRRLGASRLAHRRIAGGV